jgi:hypothetical protein
MSLKKLSEGRIGAGLNSRTFKGRIVQRIAEIERKHEYAIGQPFTRLMVDPSLALEQIGITCALQELHDLIGKKMPEYPMNPPMQSKRGKL